MNLLKVVPGWTCFSCTGCVGGVGRGNFSDNGIGSGGGHGGKGGLGCYNGSCVEGGISYGNSKLPCELGSGSGNESSADSSAGGGVIGKAFGSVFCHEHMLTTTFCILLFED